MSESSKSAGRKERDLQESEVAKRKVKETQKGQKRRKGWQKLLKQQDPAHKKAALSKMGVWPNL